MRLGRLTRFSLGVCVTLLGVAACEPQVGRWKPALGISTERDSAGVRIVENAERHPDNVFRTSAEPVLILGAEPTADAFLLEVSGAVAFDRGPIVVANGGLRQLYWYDRKGRLTDRTGGAGSDPGQFMRLTDIRRNGRDSLSVYDIRLRRLSSIHRSGVFTGSVSLPVVESMPSGLPLGMFEDGQIAAYQGSFLMRDTGTVRMERLTREIFRFDPVTDSVFTIVVANGPEVMVVPDVLPRGGMVKRRRRFGRTGVYVVWNNSLAVGDNATYEFRLYDQTGTLQTIVRKDYERLAITNDHLQRVRTAQLETILDDGVRERIAQLFDVEPPPPEFMPAFGERILVDGQDRLWVVDYGWPLGGPTEWSVFDESGRLVAHVTTPADEWVSFVSDNLVLTVVTDQSGVEQVRAYSLEKIM